MSPIKRVLTFDAFNTLFTPGQSITALYKTTAELHHIAHDCQIFQSQFPSVFKTLNTKHPNYGKNTGISYQQWWFILIDSLYPTQLTNPGYQAFRSDLYESFKSEKAYTTYPDLNPFLEHVSKRDDILMLCLSNGDPRVYDILVNLNLMKYFEEGGVKLSYDLDLNKSDPVFYETIAKEIQKKYGVQKCQFWHFGDEVKNDLKNASTAGWNAVLINRNSKLQIQDIINELNGDTSDDLAVKRRLDNGYFQSSMDDKNNDVIDLGDRRFVVNEFNHKIDQLLELDRIK